MKSVLDEEGVFPQEFWRERGRDEGDLLSCSPFLRMTQLNYSYQCSSSQYQDMPSAAEIHSACLFLLYLDKGQGPRPKGDGKLLGLGSIPLHTMQHQTYQEEVICFIPSTTTIKMKGIFCVECCCCCTRFNQELNNASRVRVRVS